MVSIDVIQEKIRVVRGEKVMLDCDLARLYGVETKRLNEQVKRNSGRFPERFMFQLTWDEFDLLRSQIATLEDDTFAATGRGKYTKYLPFAFTEHGALMVSTVLNSAQAISMSIYIIEAFVKMRSLVMSHAEILKRLDELEKKRGQARSFARTDHQRHSAAYADDRNAKKENRFLGASHSFRLSSLYMVNGPR